MGEVNVIASFKRNINLVCSLIDWVDM